MTALTHQFTGLISPLHGPFSADRAITPDNEVSPLMLAGSKQGHYRPKGKSRPGQTGSSRTIGAVIREQPIFVNLAARRIRRLFQNFSKRHNSRKYIAFAVF